MRERNPMTETINASQVRQQWSRLINKVFRGETRVVVEKSGIPVAAIISAEDLRRLNQLEDERRQRFAVLERTWTAFEDVPPEQLEAEVERAVREMRKARST
ncbi:MAG TPA: type II toxin-antitoxin system prevent-host-death family antitoxin [Chloroflexia bacterium]|jgi:prevent-host-death family protein|nr:type II toxin-antitoxin system prevent-host-death family antitoxin [Chloroflexia bacterium]